MNYNHMIFANFYPIFDNIDDALGTVLAARYVEGLGHAEGGIDVETVNPLDPETPRTHISMCGL